MSEDGWAWIGGAAATIILTTIFMATIGRPIARRSRILAVASGTLFAPTLVLIAAVAVMIGASRQSPPHDAGGMALVALTILAICALPISFLTSLGWTVGKRTPPD